ncbi:Hypothetical predicted protein [Podarcis lilfordi]|uniref:Uncharacterized protein n=1 Tax=Podarcis lilfordi TaxID=74358 RepID=A0AA35KF06_9SAUR|nr:Hypothetical predicted protein [Podarcis lilfordi]
MIARFFSVALFSVQTHRRLSLRACGPPSGKGHPPQLREAKQNLRNLILQIQTTITDPEKVQGRLNKEDKNISLKACQAKSDWLENTKEATMQDFVEQKQLLEDIMLPIFTKLATPRVQDSVNKKMGTPLEH